MMKKIYFKICSNIEYKLAADVSVPALEMQK
jgi:hypothetical protein